MSLATFKRKSVVKHGTNISGKPTDVYMLPQGPFGKPSSINSTMLENAKEQPAFSGFSINGPHRNVGGVGKNMAFSKSGTPFRGVYPKGNGGHLGQYVRSDPMFNVAQVETKGTQFMYNKPSSLTTYGMLRQKYRWAYSGTYPNYWVQPNYGTGVLSENSSQGLYIHTKSVANDCVNDINRPDKYAGDTVRTCVSMNGVNRCHVAAPYTKTLYQAADSSEHTHRMQRRCANPEPWQRPFPGPTNGTTQCAPPPKLVQ